MLLHREGIKVSEKVVRRIMKQEKLIIRRKRRQKYNSYKGEITPAVENVIDRDFHATKPNQKWLTDITEFSIKAGKVYATGVHRDLIKTCDYYRKLYTKEDQVIN